MNKKCYSSLVLPATIRLMIVSGCLLAVWLNAGNCFAYEPLTPGLESPTQTSVSTCVPPADADVRQLNLGTPIEREIQGGQSHFYQVTALADEFLRVIVDQRGIDIVATLCAPNDKQTRVDRPNGANGPEAVSIIAGHAGTFFLQVKTAEKTAPLGRYQVRLAEQRNREIRDDLRVEAEEALSEGELRRARGTLESLLEAVSKFDLARTRWHSLDEPYEEALALYGLGWSYSEIGSQGMVKFPIPVHRLRWNYESRSVHQRAVDYFNRSLVIMRQLDDRHGQAIDHAGLGWAELYLDRNKEALESFESAYELFTSAGNVRGEALVLYGIAWVNAIQGDDQNALENFLKSLPLRRAAKDKKGEAITLAGMSRVENRLGRKQEAIDAAEQALAIFRDLKDVHGQASTYSVLGWLNYSFNQPQQALEFFERSLEMRKAANDSTGAANDLFGIARVRGQQGKLAEALKQMEEVLGIIEPLRTKGETSDLRTYYFANVQEYYDYYIELLMRLGESDPNGKYVEAALAAYERARARELLAILAEAVDVNPSTASSFSQPLQTSEIKRLLDDDSLLIEYAIADEASYAWLVSKHVVRAVKIEKRAKIEESARRLYALFTIRNEHLRGETELHRRRRIELADRQSAKAAETLSLMLLGPFAGELGTKRLVIVAEGALQLIPFGALPAPSNSRTSSGRPLILDHEIVSLPSASVLAALRRDVADRGQSTSTLAVLADPVFSADDPRVQHGSERSKPIPPADSSTSLQLRSTSNTSNTHIETATAVSVSRLLGTRWEGQQIASLVPEQQRLLALDFDANRLQALSAELGRYRFIHFATHALINDNDPAASTVVLSQVDQQGRGQEGLLSLHDIYQLKLRADLVVLSACRTGLGRDIKGEGMTGLTGGFMHAGVPRVVVSLWPVNDKVTAEYMVRFYRLMLSGSRMSPSAALREVQSQMMKDKRWQSAYFWAPFVIQGEWR